MDFMMYFHAAIVSAGRVCDRGYIILPILDQIAQNIARQNKMEKEH